MHSTLGHCEENTQCNGNAVRHSGIRYNTVTMSHCIAMLQE